MSSSADGSPWAWKLQRAWVRGSTKWWAWGAGVSLAVAATLVAAWCWRQGALQANDLERQLSRVRHEAPPPLPVAVQMPDFARRLGAPLSAAQATHEIQRACAEAGVQLVTLQAQERAPSAELLGRLELAVALRGSYAGSKQVLKQVAERFGSLTVQRLRMRRGTSPNELETQAALSLWSAPLVAVPEGR